jgi:hypothetical protein
LLKRNRSYLYTFQSEELIEGKAEKNCRGNEFSTGIKRVKQIEIETVQNKSMGSVVQSV